MPRRSGASPAALLAVALLGAAGPAQGPLRFERAFATLGEPANLHYRVLYRDGGGRVHRLEVWRKGDRLIRRDTDGGVVVTFAIAGKAPDYRLVVLDKARRIRSDISRAGLYSQGNFTDWFDLAHGLKFPAGAYTLSLTARGPLTPASARPCTWYDLTVAGRMSRICWDRVDKLPLLITSESGTLVWRVMALDTGPFPRGLWDVHDEGFVSNDADQDMTKDD